MNSGYCALLFFLFCFPVSPLSPEGRWMKTFRQPSVFVSKRLFKLFLSKACGVTEVGFPEVGFPEVGSREVGSSEVGSREVSYPEVGFTEVGSPEVGSREVGFPEIKRHTVFRGHAVLRSSS